MIHTNSNHILPLATPRSFHVSLCTCLEHLSSIYHRCRVSSTTYRMTCVCCFITIPTIMCLIYYISLVGIHLRCVPINMAKRDIVKLSSSLLSLSVSLSPFSYIIITSMLYIYLWCLCCCRCCWIVSYGEPKIADEVSKTNFGAEFFSSRSIQPLQCALFLSVVCIKTKHTRLPLYCFSYFSYITYRRRSRFSTRSFYLLNNK